MIRSLQSMRFIAIFMIFLSHLGFLQQTEFANFYGKYILGGASNSGVSFFFILSGFLLAYKYYDDIKQSVNLKYSYNFTVNRIKKFYPLHLLTILVFIPNYFISYFANPLVEVPLLLSNVFLIKSFIPWDVAYFSYNAPSWFLSTLLLLYFITPPYLLKIRALLENMRYKLLIIAILIISAYAVGVGIIFILNNTDNQFTKWFVYISPFFRIIDFSIGILSGILVSYIKKAYNNKKLNVIAFSIMEILCIIIFIIAYKNRFIVDKFFRFGIYYIPILTIIVIVFSFDRGIISKIISNKVMMYFASISFEFFLIHNVVIHFMTRTILTQMPILVCILCFFVSILISIIIKKIDINNKFYMLIKKLKLSN